MTEQITQNKQQLEERVQKIRDNQDLSNQAKQRMIGEAYDEALSRHSELVSEREEATKREVADLERSVFALSYPKEVATNRDREAFRQSYRDAAFRVFNMEPENLERVLDRAERIGDGQLAQAVYHEALERGLAPLAQRYRQERPDAQRRWEKYVRARTQTDSIECQLGAAVGLMRPLELSER